MTTSPPSPASAPPQRLATVARPAGPTSTSPVRTPAQQAARAAAMVRNQQSGERLFALRLWTEFHVQLGNLPAMRSNALRVEYERHLTLYGVRDYTPFELYEAHQQQPKPQFTRQAYDMIQKEPNLVVLELLEDDNEIPEGENPPPPLFRKCEMH